MREVEWCSPKDSDRRCVRTERPFETPSAGDRTSEGRGSFRLIGPGAHSRQKSVNRLGAFNPILLGSGAGLFHLPV